VILEGHTVGQLVAALAERFPDIQPHLYDDTGALRSFINLYVGENNIKTTGGLETPVSDGAEVLLVPAIAGGVGKAI
jgi:molybdopterin converting factor small subunit